LEERSLNDFAEFSSALKNAYNIVSEEAPYADEHKVRDLLEKIKPKSQVQQMEVVKGRVRDEFPTDFNKAIAYIASRIAEIYAEDIAKLHQFGITNKRNRQVYEAKADGHGHGRGRGNGQMVNRAGRGNKRGGRGYNAGRNPRGGRGLPNMARQQITFNGINALDPNRLFTRDEWDQLGNSGRAYVAWERERMTTARRGRSRGRNDGRGGRVGTGRVVNEIVVQQRDGDTSTVTLRGGKSGAGFGVCAHRNVMAQD
jgi:hypothetical protein